LKNRIKKFVIISLFFVILVSFQVYAQDEMVIDILKNGSLEDVEDIILFSNQINSKLGEYEANYLYYAAYNDDYKVMDYLINKGGRISFKSKYGVTPLMIASTTNKNLNIIKLLLNNGADINAESNSGMTPILSSAYNSNLNIMKFLSKNGANLNDKKGTETILHIAATSNPNPDVIIFLVKQGLNINEKDFFEETPFIKALKFNNFDVVNTFLKFDNNLIYYKSKYEDNILHHAAINKNPQFLHYILENENKLFDINSRNKHGETYLMNAALYNRNINVMRYLLKNGANVNSRNIIGNTVLMKLINRYNKEDLMDRINLLVENGADLNVKDRYGDDLLSMSLSSDKKIEIINYFFNKEDYNKIELDNLFFDAVKNNKIDVVRFFLEKTTNINKRNILGATPLMYAAMFNDNPKVIELLLQGGANPKLKDNEDKTAYDYMKDNYFLNNSEIHWKLHDLKY